MTMMVDNDDNYKFVDDDDDDDDERSVMGMFMCIVKVWLCLSGADRYLKSHRGLYQQMLSGPHNEHLVELINTGKLLTL